MSRDWGRDGAMALLPTIMASLKGRTRGVNYECAYLVAQRLINMFPNVGLINDCKFHETAGTHPKAARLLFLATYRAA